MDGKAGRSTWNESAFQSLVLVANVQPWYTGVVCLMPDVESRRVNSHTVNQEPGSLAARHGYLGYESEKPCLPAAWQNLAPQEAGFVMIVG